MILIFLYFINSAARQREKCANQIEIYKNMQKLINFTGNWIWAKNIIKFINWKHGVEIINNSIVENFLRKWKIRTSRVCRKVSHRRDKTTLWHLVVVVRIIQGDISDGEVWNFIATYRKFSDAIEASMQGDDWSLPSLTPKWHHSAMN